MAGPQAALLCLPECQKLEEMRSVQIEDGGLNRAEQQLRALVDLHLPCDDGAGIGKIQPVSQELVLKLVEELVVVLDEGESLTQVLALAS